MPHTVEVDAKKQAKPDLSEELYEAWKPYARRMRAVHILRVRSGRPTKLEQDIACRFLEGEDNEQGFLDDIIADALALAERDAGGRRIRYAFRILGEPKPNETKMPSLVKDVEAWIEDDDDEPRVGRRETEVVSVLGELRTHTRDLGREHIQLAKALTSVMQQVADVVGKLGDTLTKNQSTVAEFNFKTREAEIKFDREQREADREASRREKSSARAWSFITHMGGQLGPLLEVARRWVDDQDKRQGGPGVSTNGPAASAPTREELRAVFEYLEGTHIAGASPHAPDQLRAVEDVLAAMLAEDDAGKRAAIAQRLSALWDELDMPTRGAFFFAVQTKVSAARIPNLLAWLVASGVQTS